MEHSALMPHSSSVPGGPSGGHICREYSGPSSVQGYRLLFDVRPYLYGGLAAITAEIFTFPLDTAKTRLQLQGQVADSKWKSVKYRGTIQTVMTISREEGLSVVYKGLSPAIVRQATYGTIKFGLYYSSKDAAMRFLGRGRQQEVPLVNLCCAVLAGSLSSAVATPLDVMKVRMQSRTGLSTTGLLSTLVDIWRQEGLGGLWRGVCPTSQRAGVVAGVQLPVYDWTKLQLQRQDRLVLLQDGPTNHLSASLVAGFSAAMASNPVDVVRTRMMVQRKQKKLLKEGSCSSGQHGGSTFYTSSLQCGLHTVRTEGVLALYKGFIPAFARMGPWNIIFFLVYEKLKSLNI